MCGYILGKNGYNVCVLEKNARIGGCLQSFRRGGVLFDTGMHYVGSMDEGQILHRFWKYLSLLDNVQLRKLDENGYDLISIRDREFRFAMGYERFREELCHSFPDQHRQLDEYIRRIRHVAETSPLYNLQEIEQQVFLETEHIKSSVNEFLDSVTDDPLLRNVLAGNLPLYAGVKDKTPLYIHALINNFYIQSAYRIVGGSQTIADSLAASIRRFGGEVFTCCEADYFICDREKMTGVRLTNGEVIEGERFISNIHPQKTVEKLDTPMIRKAYRDRMAQLENTVSNFTLYICFKKNSVPYLNHNFYRYDTPTVWGTENYRPEEWPQSYLFMHQAPEDGSAFSSGALLITYMNYRDVARWEGTDVGKRGEEYEAFKEERAQILLDRLERDFPGIRENIASYSTSTPLTYVDYTATKEGSMYGVLRDKNFPTQTLVSQRTRIPNLFMTGQNINSHGVLGVTIGSIITCAEFLGINRIIKDINEL